MMRTTKKQSNIIKAQRLVEVRAQLKALAIEEKALKAYFSDLIGYEDKDLLVDTAIMISKFDRSRTSYVTKELDTYFTKQGIDSNLFKKTSHYEVLTAKVV